MTDKTLSKRSAKKCPFCAEEIKEDAVKCRHCGEYLDGRGIKNYKGLKPSVFHGFKLRIHCPNCQYEGKPKLHTSERFPRARNTPVALLHRPRPLVFPLAQLDKMLRVPQVRLQGDQ